MRKAILYVRVSTDEQAEKGYSQRDQEDRLRSWCRLNAVEIVHVYVEDHSAKTFSRPQWQILLQQLRAAKKRTVDIILFTKWDRFSRNAGDAYQMINILRKIGVEPQAIEQPLDLQIPENKIMLAFYLAAPEVENDRRALNVFHGMRRAKKEGRWMATAPMGYRNTTTTDGKKMITPDDQRAPLIKWVFEEIAAGNYNTEQVWKLATKKGLRCSKNNFWLIIKNPVYCGKIVIPQFADEEEHLVDGIHRPIISRRLFNQVQDQLNGRKKNPFSKPKVVSSDNLPLRGYLMCPECDRMLSGSASKGRHDYYHYYHCSGGCHVRFKAKEVNDQFEKQLRLLIPRPGRMQIYSEVILNEFKDQIQIRARERKTILLELDKLNDRLNSARLKFVDGILESDDFQEIKKQCTTKITELEAALSNLATEKSDVSKILQQILPKLENIATLYESATVEEKRQIIGSVFPENLVFDGKQVRTARLNAGIELIYQISSKLEIKKNGTNPFKSDLSLGVHPKGATRCP